MQDCVFLPLIPLRVSISSLVEAFPPVSGVYQIDSSALQGELSPTKSPGTSVSTAPLDELMIRAVTAQLKLLHETVGRPMFKDPKDYAASLCILLGRAGQC